MRRETVFSGFNTMPHSRLQERMSVIEASKASWPLIVNTKNNAVIGGKLNWTGYFAVMLRPGSGSYFKTSSGSDFYLSFVGLGLGLEIPARAVLYPEHTQKSSLVPRLRREAPMYPSRTLGAARRHCFSRSERPSLHGRGECHRSRRFPPRYLQN